MTKTQALRLQVVSVSVRSSAAGPGLGLDDRSFYMSPVYLGFERNCQLFPCVLQTILNISETIKSAHVTGSD